jgi:hypothetical protein
MKIRTAIVVASSVLLSSCAGFGQCPGYGACTGRTTAGPYDQADLYLDAKGFPLPGFASMVHPETDGK